MKQAPWLLAEIGELTTGATVVLDAAEGRHAKGPLRLASGQIEDPKRVRKYRKAIARINTVLRERELAQEGRE